MMLSNHLKESPEEGIFMLPGGYYLAKDGLCHRDVEMRPLTGREEEILANKTSNNRVIPLLTAILANCIKRIGPIKEINSDMIRCLLVGDRDYLVLRLRQITFGDRVEARITCPNDSCKKLMDIDFDLGSIPIERKDIGKGRYIHKLSCLTAYKDTQNILHKEVEFRLPNVGDQEEISEIYEVNESKALTSLLTRCLLRLGSISNISEELVLSLTIPVRMEIESKMKELSPNVNLEMKINCPECKTDFISPFDMPGFFLKK